jgi:N-acyl-L-homoserine lactone synthetase/acyl-CoA reductase-like NAD-dependent aldehyde dehydrogenase
MRIVAGTGEELTTWLEAAIAAYRYEIFVRRFGWRLPCREGFERDQFDRPDTLYVAALDASNQVCGAARLLPTTRPYLLAQVFPEVMGGHALPRSATVWELSRFSVLPADDRRLSGEALMEMRRTVLAAAVQCAAAHGARRLITLSPLGVERLLRQLGVDAHRAAAPRRIDGKWTFACWIEIDAQTCSALDLARPERALSQVATSASHPARRSWTPPARCAREGPAAAPRLHGRTKHQALLDRAIAAAASRDYFSAYPESASPKVYGETAKADGDTAFEALMGKPFSFDDRHPNERLVGAETSPYGKSLNVRYPTAAVETLVAASLAPGFARGEASVEARAGVLLETLARLKKQSFLIADAVQHTSGQSWDMAFQAGGPHEAQREKPQGKGEPIRLAKRFRVVPRGVAVEIGCAIFLAWNLYPGLFASLATGNTVIVKPHPAAILPAAITLKILREVLIERGFDPNVAMLAADEASPPVAKDLVQHRAVKILELTGGSAFGSWLRHALKDKLVYTEEAGVNAIVIDSTSNFCAMCDNIAFSLSLYSGQMCTAPQNIFVPRLGINSDEGRKSLDKVAKGVADAVDRLLGEPARAASLLGAIRSDATLSSLKEAETLGRVVRAAAPIEGVARSATPLILAVDAGEADVDREERFGPISFVMATDSTEDSLARAESSIRKKSAITAALYTTSDAVAEAAETAFALANVALSINLMGNRRQPGGQRLADRRRIHRQPVPDRPGAVDERGMTEMRLADTRRNGPSEGKS